MSAIRLASQEELEKAVEEFWKWRAVQGKRMDGFARVISELFLRNGLAEFSVCSAASHTRLPGWFRPAKEWDLVVQRRDELVAVLEFKGQGSSFAKNFNNRVEEALGNAKDIEVAGRRGVFGSSACPWLGYLMLLQENTESIKEITVVKSHYPVDGDFDKKTYIQRYALVLSRLMQEQLYDGCCLLTCKEKDGPLGDYKVPEELTFERFSRALLRHAMNLTS